MSERREILGACNKNVTIAPLTPDQVKQANVDAVSVTPQKGCSFKKILVHRRGIESVCTNARCSEFNPDWFRVKQL